MTNRHPIVLIYDLCRKRGRRFLIAELTAMFCHAILVMFAVSGSLNLLSTTTSRKA